jgi:DNA-binding NtrC family response regulator
MATTTYFPESIGKTEALPLPSKLHEWIVTVDHKRLGILYIATALFFFAVAGVLAALNVFPIQMPPLRERTQDLPTLIEYFIRRYARKAGKKIETIEKRTMELIESYAWPGNIRELQNVIERSVIVCETDLFSVDPSWLSFESTSSRQDHLPTPRKSAAQEREVIETALAVSEGRVSGPSGAAMQLGMPASTLESKIRSLRINKFRFRKV